LKVRLAAPQGPPSAWTTYRIVKGVPAKISSGNFLDRSTEPIFFLASQWETTTSPTVMLKMIKRKLFPVTTAAKGIHTRKKRQIHPDAVGLIESLFWWVTVLSVRKAAMNHSPRGIGYCLGHFGSASVHDQPFMTRGRLLSPRVRALRSTRVKRELCDRISLLFSDVRPRNRPAAPLLPAPVSSISLYRPLHGFENTFKQVNLVIRAPALSSGRGEEDPVESHR
jgi:hypothetical protein